MLFQHGTDEAAFPMVLYPFPPLGPSSPSLPCVPRPVALLRHAGQPLLSAGVMGGRALFPYPGLILLYPKFITELLGVSQVHLSTAAHLWLFPSLGGGWWGALLRELIFLGKKTK